MDSKPPILHKPCPLWGVSEGLNNPKDRPSHTKKTTPDLPFLAFWKTARKTTQKTRISYPWRTPKIPGKEGKMPKKQGIPWKGKRQGIPKKQGKEDQGRRVNFVSVREKIRCGRSKTLRRGLRSVFFFLLGKRGRKTARQVKNHGGSKILQIRAPY